MKEIKDSFELALDNICKLAEADNNDRELIENIMFYHECEPKAAAERISQEFDLDYDQVFKLLL